MVLTFQAAKNLSTHPTYGSWPFCKCSGDFGVYLEKESSSQRISKIDGNWKL